MNTKKIVANVMREYSALFRMLEEYDRALLVNANARKELKRDMGGVSAAV